MVLVPPSKLLYTNQVELPPNPSPQILSGGPMPGLAIRYRLPLPRGWPRRVRSAAVHTISLAELVFSKSTGSLGRPCNRWDGYQAGTTFTGAGLSPARLTSLSSRCTWSTSPGSLETDGVGWPRKGELPPGEVFSV